MGVPGSYMSNDFSGSQVQISDKIFWGFFFWFETVSQMSNVADGLLILKGNDSNIGECIDEF